MYIYSYDDTFTPHAFHLVQTYLYLYYDIFSEKYTNVTLPFFLGNWQRILKEYFLFLQK